MSLDVWYNLCVQVSTTSTALISEIRANYFNPLLFHCRVQSIFLVEKEKNVLSSPLVRLTSATRARAALKQELKEYRAPVLTCMVQCCLQYWIRIHDRRGPSNITRLITVHHPHFHISNFNIQIIHNNDFYQV